jgi:protein-S-isoprenylcysteine O-methyltransferase Ste14
MSWNVTLPIFFIALQLLWLIWGGYWVASVAYEGVTNRTKETVRRRSGTGFIFLILLFFMLTPVGATSLFGTFVFAPSELVKVAGLAVTAYGVSFSIWARRQLGSNWSGVPSLKKDHVLITSGPYSLVRHPIYTGLLSGVIGSTLVLGTLASLVVVFLTILMVLIRIHQEEGLMKEEFGDAYRNYQKRAKAIIPWLL